MLKSKRQNGTPYINIGAYLNGTQDTPRIAFAYPERNQVQPEDLESDRPVGRIIATLPDWSSMTRPVDLQLLQLPRLPIPTNFEIASKLLESAERSNEVTQTIFQAKTADALSYDFIKTNGHEQLYLTTAPSDDSREAAERIREHISSPAQVIVEPRMHSHWRAARHFALQKRFFEQTASDPEKTPNVAVLAITKTGYGFAIGPINHSTPVYAPEELADAEMLQMSASLSDRALAESALELLEEKMEPAALTDQRINARAEIATFVTCEEQIWKQLAQLLRSNEGELTTKTGIPLYPLNIHDAELPTKQPSDPAEVAAYGAALGTLIPAEEIVNLADPLPERVERIRQEKEAQEARSLMRRRTLAALLLLTLPLITLGWMTGSWYAATSEVSELKAMKSQKEARSRELQAFIKKRSDANLNFAYCMDLSKQIFIQRAKQPAVAGLLTDLDYLWPTNDPSWYVSGLAIQAANTGQIEIRGRARTLDSFTEFTKALEGLTDQNGASKFTNIRPTTGEVGVGGAQGALNATPSIQPILAPQQAQGAAVQRAPQQGPFEWTITATYTPLTIQPNPVTPPQQQQQAPTPQGQPQGVAK